MKPKAHRRCCTAAESLLPERREVEFRCSSCGARALGMVHTVAGYTWIGPPDGWWILSGWRCGNCGL